MNSATRTAFKRQSEEEARHDLEYEQRIERGVRRYRLIAVAVGLSLAASVAADVPFLYGYPLHNYWDVLGKWLVILSMCLLSAFVFFAATAFNWWTYLRNIKKIHREFGPPDTRSRLGKNDSK